MAKTDNNFLKGWARQLRQALDDGDELAYECAELIEESLASVGFERPDDGDGADVDEMDDADPDGGEVDAASSGRGLRGSEDPKPDVPGLARRVDNLRDELLGDSGVPRGTRGGAAATVVDGQPANICKRRPR